LGAEERGRGSAGASAEEASSARLLMLLLLLGLLGLLGLLWLTGERAWRGERTAHSRRLLSSEGEGGCGGAAEE
jgi:hypothetical protein